MSGARVGVGVLGATGYTGAELVRLLQQHPHARLLKLSSRQSAGVTMATAFPALEPLPITLDGEAVDAAAWRAAGVEVLFACLPHGAFAARAVAFLQAGMRVVDLSADFRLETPAAYETHYHAQHPAPQLLAQATYGLAEWCDAAGASLVANPGCYATSILLAALPPAAAGWLADAPIIVNAVSGVSGAGRGAKLDTQFGECANSVAPYKVGETHAHLGEVGRMLRQVGCPQAVVFNPHLVPMARGIVSTVALPLRQATTLEAARELYAQRYRDRPFVRLLADDALPQTRYVRGSNRCDLALRVVASGKLLLAFAAIDNLVKGAAGQAVQNWNRLQGWPETLGLPQGGIACA